MDFSFLSGGNPIYILVGFTLFHYCIAQPYLELDLTHSILLFIVLYVLYKKYGNSFLDRYLPTSTSFFGFGKKKRR
jgi:hypothetical protein